MGYWYCLCSSFLASFLLLLFFVNPLGICSCRWQYTGRSSLLCVVPVLVIGVCAAFTLTVSEQFNEIKNCILYWCMK